jgi:class 3 adenylate cyclase
LIADLSGLFDAGSRADAAIYIITCVGKANVSRQALVEAIASLEAQRGLAGDNQPLLRAIDTALQALREELATSSATSGKANQRQLTVLVADLSGFTALSERMDAENVRHAINAMWGVLDEVILSWGGRIDQHAGDSLTALFGLPHPRGGDAGRALHAALALQKELELFNERVRRAGNESSGASWMKDWPGPSMRIGIHSGPVYFARASNNAQPADAARATAVGETVATARRLERLAPIGGVLASAAVYRQAQSRFEMALFPDAGRLPVGSEANYLAKGEKIEAETFKPGTVVGQATRLVGRTEQIDRLEIALQSVVESRTAQMVTIVGPPGGGKSRLVSEFEGRARLLAGRLTVLHAEARRQYPDAPFSLVRDLLLRHLGIRPQHGRYLVEHKLREGLAELNRPDRGARLPPDGDLAARALSLFERLIDVRTAGSTPVDDVLAVVEPLLHTATRDGPALVILEGLHRADGRSLELVDRLLRGEVAAPVLFLGVAEDVDPAKIPWLASDDDLFSPFERLDLPLLTAIESRLMATQILGSLSPPPMRLLDLIVAESAGNPLYIEAFIRLLIERKALVTGERWRVDMASIEAFRLPVGLPGLMAAQLAQLPQIEREVLRRAAVYGAFCWDTALLEMGWPADIDEVEIETALLSLELKGYLSRDELYSFADAQAYAFRGASLRKVAYKSISPAERRAMHLEAAHWLIANRKAPRFAAWFRVDDMIARHFALGGNESQAGVGRPRESLTIGR